MRTFTLHPHRSPKKRGTDSLRKATFTSTPLLNASVTRETVPIRGKSAGKYKRGGATCPFVPNKHFRASVLFSLLSGKGNNGTLRQYYSSPKQYRQENIPKKRGIKANIGCWMKYLSPFYTLPPPSFFICSPLLVPSSGRDTRPGDDIKPCRSVGPSPRATTAV